MRRMRERAARVTRVLYKMGSTPRTARGTPTYVMMSEARALSGILSKSEAPSFTLAMREKGRTQDSFWSKQTSLEDLPSR